MVDMVAASGETPDAEEQSKPGSERGSSCTRSRLEACNGQRGSPPPPPPPLPSWPGDVGGGGVVAEGAPFGTEAAAAARQTLKEEKERRLLRQQITAMKATSMAYKAKAKTLPKLPAKLMLFL